MKPKAQSAGDRAISGLSLTRRDIKEAAKGLIAVQGYTATTVRQIARKVSMKGGSLYYHFGGKDEILFAILDEGNRLLLDATGRVLKLNLKGAPEILRRLIREHIRILAEDPAQFMVVTRELNRLKGERRQRIMAQRDQYEEVIQNVLTQGIKEKSIRPCNVKLVSYGVISLLNGVAFWYRPGGRLSIERIAEEYSQVLLDGLRT
jgi:TetR/AcrR family transcriptional regulator, cholesterol catabolism regulator